jgi:hypothetical protein
VTNTDESICNVSSHFLDSGAFTLTTKADEYARINNCSKWDFYDTNEHWDYVDSYAAFVKEYKVAIDLYANVDAIGNAELTWRNQLYLEKKHGLDPVPVFHQRSDMKWFKRYLARGHEVIGLGWLNSRGFGPALYEWLDATFGVACPAPSRLPLVKLHGFGVTSFKAMTRYPWWSVDSATWTKTGAFGGVIIPHRAGGEWKFDRAPYTLWFTEDAPAAEDKGKHYKNVSRAERKIIDLWLDEIGVPLGEDDTDGEPKVLGVLNHHSERNVANLLYFERFRLSLPEYPWAFRPPPRRKGMAI